MQWRLDKSNAQLPQVDCDGKNQNFPCFAAVSLFPNKEAHQSFPNFAPAHVSTQTGYESRTDWVRVVREHKTTYNATRMWCDSLQCHSRVIRTTRTIWPCFSMHAVTVRSYWKLWFKINSILKKSVFSPLHERGTKKVWAPKRNRKANHHIPRSFVPNSLFTLYANFTKLNFV